MSADIQVRVDLSMDAYRRVREFAQEHGHTIERVLSVLVERACTPPSRPTSEPAGTAAESPVDEAPAVVDIRERRDELIREGRLTTQAIADATGLSVSHIYQRRYYLKTRSPR